MFFVAAHEVPMWIVCRNRVFVVNAQRLAGESPLFAFELLSRSSSWRRKKRERMKRKPHQNQYEMLSREIVDEKWEDIDTFLHCLHRHDAINETDSRNNEADGVGQTSIYGAPSSPVNKEQCSATSRINGLNFCVGKWKCGFLAFLNV